MRAGVKVCLGNDGFSNAMWSEWKTAYLAHKLWHSDPRRLGADQVARMAIYNNSALANHIFKSQKIGTIEKGACADLIFVDYHPFTPLTEGNLPWHIVFGFHESMITSTMVNGVFLMRNRELLTIDEEKIASDARKMANEVWQRYQNFTAKGN